MTIAILTINQPSLDAASRLVTYLPEHNLTVFGKEGLTHTLESLRTFGKLDDILPEVWTGYDAIIAIMATGAVVRKVAPYLQDKATDPAVIVINLSLDRVLPLLGGHLGGANALTAQLAERIPGCIPFVSTATDQTGTVSFEMLAKERGWGIVNLQALAAISNRLLNKQKVKVATCQSIFESLPNQALLERVDWGMQGAETIVIAPHVGSDALTLQPGITLGIGCNRDTKQTTITRAVEHFLSRHGLKREQITGLASFEAKADEVGLLAFAEAWDLPIQFFDKETINGLEESFSPSASTKHFGLKGVAEPSAVLGSVWRQLILSKEVFESSVTLAGAI